MRIARSTASPIGKRSSSTARPVARTIGTFGAAARTALGGDDASVRGTLQRIAREHAREDLVEDRRYVLPDVAHARRRLEEHLREDRDLVVAREGRQTGEALEEHRAEREHVGARVE